MKKFVSFILVSSLLFVAACGGSSSSDEAKSEKKTIVYWSMWNEAEAQGQVIKAAIADYMQKYPDIVVEINWNGRTIRQTLQPALDNNQTIDLWDEDLERTTRNWQNYALKLDSYIAQTYDTTDGRAYQDTVIKPLLDLGKTFSTDGGLYAIPYQPVIFAIMYNKDHFKNAGITKTPETWTEFLDACAKLVASGKIPITVDDAYVDCLLGYQLAKYKGSDFVRDLVTQKLWDDPAVLSALKDWETMQKNGYISKNVAGNKFPAGQQEIANGEVTMYLNGTWLINEIMPSTGIDFPWGQFPYPSVGGTDTIYDMNYGAQSFQINKNTKYPDEVFGLVVHMTTGRWDKELAEKTYGVPVAGTTDWPVQLADAKVIFGKLGKFYPWAAGMQENSDIFPAIAANFTRLISGQMTAEQFITEIKK